METYLEKVDRIKCRAENNKMFGTFIYILGKLPCYGSFWQE